MSGAWRDAARQLVKIEKVVRVGILDHAPPVGRDGGKMITVAAVKVSRPLRASQTLRCGTRA